MLRSKPSCPDCYGADTCSGLLPAASADGIRAPDTAALERHQPRRPAQPRLPVRPGDAALWRRRRDGRPPPLATNSLSSKHKSSSLAGIARTAASGQLESRDVGTSRGCSVANPIVSSTPRGEAKAIAGEMRGFRALRDWPGWPQDARASTNAGAGRSPRRLVKCCCFTPDMEGRVSRVASRIFCFRWLGCSEGVVGWVGGGPACCARRGSDGYARIAGDGLAGPWFVVGSRCLKASVAGEPGCSEAYRGFPARAGPPPEPADGMLWFGGGWVTRSGRSPSRTRRTRGRRRRRSGCGVCCVAPIVSTCGAGAAARTRRSRSHRVAGQLVVR